MEENLLDMYRTFYQKLELESAGWLPRLALQDLLYFEQWNQNNSEWSKGLKESISKI